jgi:transposase
MDSLPGHNREALCDLIEAASATLRFMPPYSPDINPNEKAFARFKATLRYFSERTVSGLWNPFDWLAYIFQPSECGSNFS